MSDPKVYRVNVGVRFNRRLIRLVGRVLSPLVRHGLVSGATARRALLQFARYRINDGPWRRMRHREDPA